ncbi:MAG: hypothetical protein WDO18_11605 [Acidobacteriota bacterium]
MKAQFEVVTAADDDAPESKGKDGKAAPPARSTTDFILDEALQQK